MNAATKKPKYGPGPWIVLKPQYDPPMITAADGSCVSDRVFNGNEELAGAAWELLDVLKSLLGTEIWAGGETSVVIGESNEPAVNAAHALVRRIEEGA